VNADAVQVIASPAVADFWPPDDRARVVDAAGLPGVLTKERADTASCSGSSNIRRFSRRVRHEPFASERWYIRADGSVEKTPF